MPTISKARRLDELDAAVALALMSGHERLNGRLEAERFGLGGNIVNDAVGQKNSPADALRRNVFQNFGERAEELGAVIARCVVGDRDRARLDVAEFCERRVERLARLFRLRVSRAEILAVALVDYHRDDALLRIAFFAHERRVGERRNQ